MGNGSLSFKSLTEANVLRQKEWDPSDAITLSYRGNELAGEVGEACNVVKKLERERIGIRGSRATIEQLAEELADAIICVNLLAIQAGVDLGAAVVDKFNKTSQKYGLSVFLRGDVVENLKGPVCGHCGEVDCHDNHPTCGCKDGFLELCALHPFGPPSLPQR